MKWSISFSCSYTEGRRIIRHGVESRQSSTGYGNRGKALRVHARFPNIWSVGVVIPSNKYTFTQGWLLTLYISDKREPNYRRQSRVESNVASSASVIKFRTTRARSVDALASLVAGPNLTIYTRSSDEPGSTLSEKTCFFHARGPGAGNETMAIPVFIKALIAQPTALQPYPPHPSPNSSFIQHIMCACGRRRASLWPMDSEYQPAVEERVTLVLSPLTAVADRVILEVPITSWNRPFD